MGSARCRLLKRSISWNRVGEPVMWFLLLLSFAMTRAEELSQRAGCHLFNSTELISIENCVEFHFSANGCRGYCESYATATNPTDLQLNPRQPVTSISSCCDMDETEYIKVRVLCVMGTRELTFRSAKSCSCSACKKN